MLVPATDRRGLGSAKEPRAMSPVADRQTALTEAVTAYNLANPTRRLPRPAARLLVIMFAEQDVCRLSQQALRAKGFGNTLPSMLRALVEAGFVSKQIGTSRQPYTYRLRLASVIGA
jgi:hypothetical protein